MYNSGWICVVLSNNDNDGREILIAYGRDTLDKAGHWGELSSSIVNLKREVTLVQEKESQELAQKISKSSYQFQCKGHEHQFNFNATVQELIAAARSELVKVTPMEDREKEALQKVEASLDEGAKSLATRQKGRRH